MLLGNTSTFEFYQQFVESCRNVFFLFYKSFLRILFLSNSIVSWQELLSNYQSKYIHWGIA